MNTIDFSALTPRARNQDEEAVMALIEHCQSRIVAAIEIAGVGRYDADFDDAQNQALFEIWKQFPKLRKSESVCFWMHGIARRMTASRIIDVNVRHRNRKHKFEQVQPSDGAIQPDFGSNIANRDLLTRVLSELSVEHREVLVLRFLEGFSEAETGQLLGIGTKTVSSRTSRAKRAAMNLVRSFEGSAQ